MANVELHVKEAFIEIYFKNGNYVKTLNEQLLSQIRSLVDIETDENNMEFISILDKHG